MEVFKIIIYLILLVLCILGLVMSLKIQGWQKENEERIQNLKKKYGVPQYDNIVSTCTKSENGFRRWTDYTIWKSDDKLNFCDLLNDDIAIIYIDKIKFYAKNGEEHFYNKISGGGGGGSSIGGAIVGGAIAGPVGAIIGSRKKVNEIRSEVQKIDNSQTTIYYVDDGVSKSIVFSASDLYNYLLKIIPEKEMNQVAIANKVNENDGNVSNRLRELSELRKDGIITEEEFNQQKKKLLDKV